MRESDLVGIDAIVCQQKPTRTALVQVVHPIAGGELTQHIYIRLEKSAQYAPKAVVGSEQSVELVAGDDNGATRNLAITFISRARGSEQKPNRRCTLTAHRAHFDRATVAHFGYH